MPSPQQRTGKSVRLVVPASDVLAVEHPCVVRNAEKAIDMIGGSPALTQALDENSEKTFALSFHPQDPAARTILANRRQASNVLLRVTVPARTGRKRKRGSNDSWTEETDSLSTRKDAAYLVRSIRDNPSSQTVRALSNISSTHVWRAMPDLVYSTAGIQILQDVKSQLLAQSYPAIKQFKMARTHGLEDTTAVPPLAWSNQSIPFNYTYRQNPFVKLVKDSVTGKALYKNTQEAPKIFNYQVQWDNPEYPSDLMPGIPSLETSSDILKTTTEALRALFDERPIWTRRALLNCLQSDLSSFNVVRYCLAYVSYAVRSGPWRDTYVRLGVDPRNDPACRVYQTIMLQLVPKQLAAGETTTKQYKPGSMHGRTDISVPGPPPETNIHSNAKLKVSESRHTYARFWSRSNDPTSHIFDGKSPVPPDGKVWQLCDITDPQIAALRDISPDQLRSQCEARYFGWYWDGTCAKIRVALKAKVDALMDDRICDSSALEPVLSMPERVPSDSASISTLTQSRVPNDRHYSADEDAEDVTSSGRRSDATLFYLPPNSTKQQLEWAALYRSLLKTNPGGNLEIKPAQVSRLKIATPKRSKRAAPHVKTPMVLAQQAPAAAVVPEADMSMSAELLNPSPDDVELPEVEEASPEVENVEQDGDVMPSIEVNDFRESDGDNDDELGLDIEVKLEDDDDQFDEPV